MRSAPAATRLPFHRDGTFTGGHEWLADHGVSVTILDDERCVTMMADFIAANPRLWNEDIGVSD
jgi:cytosine/creatinine deaminase